MAEMRLVTCQEKREIRVVIYRDSAGDDIAFQATSVARKANLAAKLKFWDIKIQKVLE